MNSITFKGQMRTTLIAAVVLALLPRAAVAQRVDEVQHRNECRLAAQVITTGNPASKTVWAASRIGTCGAAAGAAVADGLRANRASRDMAVLSRLGDVAVVLRDGAMFEAATSILEDAGASPEARVFASRVLVLGLQPHLYVTYPQLAEGDCYGAFRGGDATPTRGGAPISSGLVERARDAGRRVSGDSATPAIVRSAARCVAIHDAAPFREPEDGPESTVVMRGITLGYVCGNTFRVHNPYLVEMTIQYGVERGGTMRSAVVPAEGERTLTADRAGTLAIRYEDGEPITSARNEGRACTP